MAGGLTFAANGATVFAVGGGIIIAAGDGTVIIAGGGRLRIPEPPLRGTNLNRFVTFIVAGGGSIIAAGDGTFIVAGGGTLFAAGGSRLMIPGPPSRGTKISRLIFGFGRVFCHVARGSQERGGVELLIHTLFETQRSLEHRYTHQNDFKTRQRHGEN